MRSPAAGLFTFIIGTVITLAVVAFELTACTTTAPDQAEQGAFATNAARNTVAAAATATAKAQSASVAATPAAAPARTPNPSLMGASIHDDVRLVVVSIDAALVASIARI